MFKNFLINLNARLRLFVSICLSTLVAVILPHNLHLPTRILCAWDMGMVVFLTLAWLTMLNFTPERMRLYAQREDQSRLAISILVIAAACASVLAIGFILKYKNVSTIFLAIHLTISVITILGSWFLVHTIFALHYARGYYRHSEVVSEGKVGGLDFPNENEPDYWDFLYFSFVVGMTSQVSDVQVTSRSMRRLTLIHGVLSFFFNTTILAMTINIIAGLI